MFYIKNSDGWQGKASTITLWAKPIQGNAEKMQSKGPLSVALDLCMGSNELIDQSIVRTWLK
jgi:hypothetical protein